MLCTGLSSAGMPRPYAYRMPLKKNILANYLGTGAVVLAPILALPWYLSELGARQFGLIGFIVLFQTVLGLLDAGLGQALVREFAVRFDATEVGRRNAASLLFGFERIYWVFAVGVAALAMLLAGPVATQWLNLNGLPESVGREAVLGAALIFAFQFPGSVYRSLLIGAQAQVPLNATLLAGALLRHGGGVAVVIAWPTLTAYLAWHVAIALLETLVRARLAWGTLQTRRSRLAWDAAALRPVWKLFAGMSGAALLGALTVQMDRIVLSRMVDIEQFGYYSIAATVAVGSLQLIHPLTQAMLPRAIQLRADAPALRRLNFRLLGLIAAVVASCALVFAALGEWLLGVWLKSPAAVSIVHPLLSVLLAGTALNAFYNVGYMNWLASRRIDRVFQVNALSLALAATLIPFLVSSYGAPGAAFGWLAINLTGCALSLEWLRRNGGIRQPASETSS